MDIKIFVSHRIDKKSVIIDNPLFYNVRCGAVFDKEPSEIPGDDTGDNISSKRLSYCELTVHYWAWKNMKADYYGFCHYRRYLSFAERVYPENPFGVIEYPQIDNTAIDRFRLDELSMRREIEKYDIITNVPIPVKQSGDFCSVYDYCKKNPQGYKIKDIQTLREVIQEKYPQDVRYFDKFFEGTENRWYNCYIMNSRAFNEYASWLFDILFEFEKRTDISNYTQEQLRVFGIMAERLWGIFLLKVIDEKKYKICEKQLVYFAETEPVPRLQTCSKDRVPVFIPIDKNAIPLAWVTINSLLENSSKQNLYTITCLHTGIKNEDIDSLLKLSEKYSNVEIVEFDVSFYVKHYRTLIRQQIGESDLISFSVFDICKQYDKIILLTPSMLLLYDIADIFDFDLSNKCAAAPVHSLMLINCYQNEAVQDFFSKHLKQKEPRAYYNFNISVLNVKKILDKYTASSFVKMMDIHPYGSPFCDILNSKLYNQIDELTTDWAVVADCNNLVHDHARWFLPYREYSNYIEAYKKPKAIYFSWLVTPWTNPDIDFSNEYWRRLRGTQYYEKALNLFISQKSSEVLYGLNTNLNSILDTRSSARKFADRILPLGSRRRQFVKWLIPRDSKRWRFCKRVYYIFEPKYRPQNVKREIDN